MTAPPPLRANPGGQLAVDEIVGRDDLALEVFDTLERRSVALLGERRLGKTTLTTLIDAMAPERGWHAVKVSVEGPESADELERLLACRIDLVGRSWIAKKVISASRHVDGASLAGVSAKPASRSLDEVVEVAMRRIDDRLLLALDELPIFVREAERRSPGSGLNMLHRLRRLREDLGLRMLMLGSVGFHHTVKDVSGVLNEVDKPCIGPLDEGDALDLAERLLRGEGLCGVGRLEVAAEVAARADHVPYYIHSIVEAAKRRPDRASFAVADVDPLVEAHLAGPDWNMRHYRDRIPRYYGDDADLATAVLDAVAHERRLDLDGAHARLNLDAAVAPVERAAVREMLVALEDDHYLLRDRSGRRSFAFELVRRAWIATGR